MHEKPMRDYVEAGDTHVVINTWTRNQHLGICINGGCRTSSQGDADDDDDVIFSVERICSIGRTFSKPATAVAASKTTTLACWGCYRCRCCCCCRRCSFCPHHWCHFCNTGDASDAAAAAGSRCLIEVITLSISANRVGVQRIARQSR